MIIAIDGTLASGKGTIARAVAAAFGLPYMDTGRLYRATGVGALKAGLDFDDHEALAKLASGLNIDDFDELAQLTQKVANEVIDFADEQGLNIGPFLRLLRAIEGECNWSDLDVQAFHDAHEHVIVRYQNNTRKGESAVSESLSVTGINLVSDITDKEEMILEALGDETMKGETLATKAGYPNNSSFRTSLSSMVKRGILGKSKKPRGYFVTDAVTD